MLEKLLGRRPRVWLLHQTFLDETVEFLGPIFGVFEGWRRFGWDHKDRLKTIQKLKDRIGSIRYQRILNVIVESKIYMF